MTEQEIAELLQRYQRPQALPTTRGTPFAPPGPEPEARSYTPPWYDRVSDWATALLHGPDANAQQRASVHHILGPENPLNLPAQFSEGFNTAKQGYDLGNAGMVGLGGLGMAMALPIGAPKGARPRAIDPLGYYSQALEAAHALPQAKGTPEQMLAQMKKAGVKDAEIAATGLDAYLTGRPSVTRDEIAKHLEQNRVSLNEVNRGGSMDVLEAEAQRNFGRSWDELSPRDQRDIGRLVQNLDQSTATKWSKNSLDPSNPTYRETVLHLPELSKATTPPIIREAADLRARLDEAARSGQPTADIENQLLAVYNRQREAGLSNHYNPTFKSRHFPEPNIVGHMMTSITEHEGKPVYTIDQIQSDWGQELRKVKAASVDHPLVNTTDQWVNTTLRRALTDAAERNAEFMAIPSGKTVLGYNPGGEQGMSAFYDNIVPKNLAKLLAKMDPAAASRIAVQTLDSPSGAKGLGAGFSLFPLTEAVKRHIKEKGQPLFAAPIAYGMMPPTGDDRP